MKGGILAAGAVLLIIGFILFWQSYSVIQQYSTSLGQFALALSGEARQQYQRAQGMAIFSGILGLVGLVTCIYGAVAKPTAPKPTPPPITRVCPYCGRVIAPDVKFCPYCGRSLV